MDDSNKTTSTEEASSSIESLVIVQVTFYTAITVIGTIANLALCGALLRIKHRRRASEYFILNLAITDLMTCIVGIPLDIAVILNQHWPFGAGMCKIVYPFQTVLISASVGTLTCMAIERYRAIMTPFKPMFSQKVVKILICAVWCTSIILVSPYSVILEQKDHTCYESWQGDNHPKIFTMCMFLFFYAIPLSVIAPAYARIGFRLHNDDRTMRKFSKKQGSGNKQFKALVRQRSKSNVMIVKTFLFGAVAFAICLLPYHVMWLWHDFGKGSQWAHFSDTLVFANALVYFNSLVDPFIFGGTVALNWRKNCTAILATCLTLIRWNGNPPQSQENTTLQQLSTQLSQLSTAKSPNFVEYASSV